ncbi:MAG TPA: GNAT family N-acetyltransferase [Euryarchaeota archaeon]|nr:GNAT family N-acetyltransferase [Euryarchaeota archaeon]
MRERTGGEETKTDLIERYPEKFIPEDRIFQHIHRGDRIFISTACAEPQYLVGALIRYVESHPKAFFDAEIIHVWTLGVAPYTQEKFKRNFRHNSFFIGPHTRDAVNTGRADYTPIFLSQVPKLFYTGMVELDVSLIQVSVPDNHGYCSLGVSVDIVKAAVENSKLVIAQINPRMPRVHGDGFIHMDDINFAVYHEEPLLELKNEDVDTGVEEKIGRYVARLVQNGDTIQVGYGSIPNAVMKYLGGKKHLGVHTELLTPGIVELIKKGVVDNTKKTINRYKTVATFCMGDEKTYDFINDNPSIEFRTVDYTNNPRIIAQHDNMTAINSALEVDLTGQASAESIGNIFYSGIGGNVDFMRGAVMAKSGKSILALPSTARNGEVSRIVPYIREGAGITLTRGDIHYVVTEYGIAYLHGKNIRERALELISIAHPKFRPWLIMEAKKRHLIYEDQAFVPGRKGEYPEELETFRRLKDGSEIKLRPVKISDEPLLKDFFYSLSANSMYRRFLSARLDMPHERLQDFVVVDYTRRMVILAVIEEGRKEKVVGVGEYSINEGSHTAEIAVAVLDAYQNKGIGTELVRYLTHLARKQGLLGFTAEVLQENKPMLHIFKKMGFDIQSSQEDGICELRMWFRVV